MNLKNRGIQQDEDAGYKYEAIGGAIIFIFLAIYYLIEEIEKII